MRALELFFKLTSTHMHVYLPVTKLNSEIETPIHLLFLDITPWFCIRRDVR